MAEGCGKGDADVAKLALRASAALVLVSLIGVGSSARADWWSENVELHGKASSTLYFNAPSMNHAFQMDQWWNQVELDTDVRLYSDEDNSLTFHMILMPTYDAVYDVYPKMFGDRRKAASPGSQEAIFARPAMNGNCGAV